MWNRWGILKGVQLPLKYLSIKIFLWKTKTRHFPSTFLQPVNGSKKSILNWVMKLSLFVFFVFLFLRHLWKIFHSIHLFFLLFWLRYLQTHMKEKYMYLFSQVFFKTNHKTLKFKEKSKKNEFSSNLQT